MHDARYLRMYQTFFHPLPLVMVLATTVVLDDDVVFTQNGVATTNRHIKFRKTKTSYEQPQAGK